MDNKKVAAAGHETGQKSIMPPISGFGLSFGGLLWSQ